MCICLIKEKDYKLLKRPKLHSRFSSCHDLILSRFCATDYKEHGVTGIRVHRITRVHNRLLRSRFEDKVGHLTDETDGEFYPGVK